MKQLSPLPVQLQNIKAKLAVKAAKEKLYEKYTCEVQNMLEALNKFVFDFGEAVARAEAMEPETDEKALKDADRELSSLCTQADHHLGGAKAAIGRFKGIVG